MAVKDDLEAIANQQWARIGELVQLGQSDPIRASDSLREIQGLMGQLATLGYPVSPRAGCPRVFRVEPIGPVAPLTTTDESPSLRFAQSGIVLAMYGDTLPSADISREVAAQSINVNFRWNGGDRSFVSNGQGNSFAQYSALFTPTSPWFPLQLFVRGGDTTWSVQFRNTHPTYAVQPTLYFSFLPAPPPMVEALAKMWGDG